MVPGGGIYLKESEEGRGSVLKQVPSREQTDCTKAREKVSPRKAYKRTIGTDFSLKFLKKFVVKIL